MAWLCRKAGPFAGNQWLDQRSRSGMMQIGIPKYVVWRLILRCPPCTRVHYVRGQ
jgi:hypothetical protein